MREFLIWLLEGKSYERSVVSIMVHAVAVALDRVGVRIRTEGRQAYETEPIVLYSANAEGLH